jgi:hypothetical protein
MKKTHGRCVEGTPGAPAMPRTEQACIRGLRFFASMINSGCSASYQGYRRCPAFPALPELSAFPELPALLSSRTDRNAGQEHEDTAKHYLKNGRDKWSIHVVVADPSDNCELDRYHDDSYPGGDVEIWN